MRTFAIACIIILALAFSSGTVFAGCLSGCNGLSGNLAGNIKIDFRPFSGAVAQQNIFSGGLIGGLKLNYNSNVPRYVFQNADLGRIGLTYKFTAPKPTIPMVQMPSFSYSIPLKQIPEAEIKFAYPECEPRMRPLLLNL
jgi:hypothetical protein